MAFINLNLMSGPSPGAKWGRALQVLGTVVWLWTLIACPGACRREGLGGAVEHLIGGVVLVFLLQLGGAALRFINGDTE